MPSLQITLTPHDQLNLKLSDLFFGFLLLQSIHFIFRLYGWPTWPNEAIVQATAAIMLHKKLQYRLLYASALKVKQHFEEELRRQQRELERLREVCEVLERDGDPERGYEAEIEAEEAFGK